jgi:hypothetical protein
MKYIVQTTLNMRRKEDIVECPDDMLAPTSPPYSADWSHVCILDGGWYLIGKGNIFDTREEAERKIQEIVHGR